MLTLYTNYLEAVMLILLSDGAGLTARQCATVLARASHRVEALSPPGLCLCRMTRHVRRVHDVPALGRDPFGWLEAALDVAGRRGADLLLPVQEQVAVMSLARDRIAAAGLATAVPAFAALAQVQDKVSAHRTLARLGVPQPPAIVAASAAEVEAAGAELAGWPLFAKMPIGTAARTGRGSSTSTRGSSSRSTPWPAASTWPGRWSRWPGPARPSRSRLRGQGRGPTSCCSRCSARPSRAGGGT
jgi:hypothetical protein